MLQLSTPYERLWQFLLHKESWMINFNHVIFLSEGFFFCTNSTTIMNQRNMNCFFWVMDKGWPGGPAVLSLGLAVHVGTIHILFCQHHFNSVLWLAAVIFCGDWISMVIKLIVSLVQRWENKKNKLMDGSVSDTLLWTASTMGPRVIPASRSYCAAVCPGQMSPH